MVRAHRRLRSADTRSPIGRCHVNCKLMWDEYEKCEKRIEAKVGQHVSHALGLHSHVCIQAVA